jgi:hypothetical protein
MKAASMPRPVLVRTCIYSPGVVPLPFHGHRSEKRQAREHPFELSVGSRWLLALNGRRLEARCHFPMHAQRGARCRRPATPDRRRCRRSCRGCEMSWLTQGERSGWRSAPRRRIRARLALEGTEDAVIAAGSLDQPQEGQAGRDGVLRS